jgi:hypothetical protein
MMMDRANVQRYLCAFFKEPVAVTRLTLGGTPQQNQAKSYGYGVPVRVDYRIDSGAERTLVLHTMSAGPFGHEDMADRAQILLWEHKAFNRLRRHVRALDVGGFDGKGELVSLGNIDEFCLVTETRAEKTTPSPRVSAGSKGDIGVRRFWSSSAMAATTPASTIRWPV